MRMPWRYARWKEKRRSRRLIAAAEQATASFPNVRSAMPHRLPGELIVTLTSYPARFATLARTLRSLLDQSIRPDRTILWIDEAALDRVPGDVRALEQAGLELRGCRDLRSYTKLIPALAAFPEAFHVTADDDVYYPPDWLERLTAEFDPARPAILAMRAHLATADARGALRPYREWELATHRRCDDGARRLLFPTGVAGVLYPPRALGPDVSDEATFMALCPHADDLWGFWMAARHGTEQRRVAGAFDIVNWPRSQDVGLFHENWLGDRNDRQIRALEARFGPVGGPRGSGPSLR